MTWLVYDEHLAQPRVFPVSLFPFFSFFFFFALGSAFIIYFFFTALISQACGFLFGLVFLDTHDEEVAQEKHNTCGWCRRARQHTCRDRYESATGVITVEMSPSVCKNGNWANPSPTPTTMASQ